MIEFIIICSLAFYGWGVTKSEDMIFENTSVTLDKWFGLYEDGFGNDKGIIPKWLRILRRPLYSCPICMPSIWGSAAYWIINCNAASPWYSLVTFWLLSIFAMSGLVYILISQFPIEYD